MNKKDIESIVFLVSATIMMMQCKITTRNSRHGIRVDMQQCLICYMNYKRNLKQGYKALVVCADGGTISYPSDWSEEKVRESFKEENKEGEFFFELSDFEK